MNTENLIKLKLDECLSPGKYSQLFLNDLIDLSIHQNISPEVIFREIRTIDGNDPPLLNNWHFEPFVIDLINDDPKEALRGILRPSPVATQRSTEFKNPPVERSASLALLRSSIGFHRKKCK